MPKASTKNAKFSQLLQVQMDSLDCFAWVARRIFQPVLSREFSHKFMQHPNGLDEFSGTRRRVLTTKRYVEH